MKELGLYIHIPFCLKKCYYCDFASFAGMEGKIEDYVDGLILEVDAWKDKLRDYQIKSIFIGGGTPTIVPIGEMNRLIQHLYKVFAIKKEIEFSIEGNPGTFDKEKLHFYRRIGINRMSIGFQAWQEELLTTLGRIHSKDQFVANYHSAREVGFDNINIDLMFGLPNQTMDQWQETLYKIEELKPEHISAYSLKIEEGTKFDKLYDQGLLHLPTEEMDRCMYHYSIEFLRSKGYHHYEISNFAQRGKECIHNKLYWHNEEYIGLGLNAHSYFNKQRFSNTGNLENYIHRMRKKENAIHETISVSHQEEMADTMFLGLRMKEGINFIEFQHRFGISPMVKYKEKIEKLIGLGLLECDVRSIRLSPKGIDLSNQVFMEFLPD